MGNSHGSPVNIYSKNQCLSVPTTNIQPGMPLVTNYCSNEPEQVFSYDAGTKEITHGSWCLAVDNAAMPDGTWVKLYGCDGSMAQKWNVGQNQITSALNPSKCMNIGNNYHTTLSPELVPEPPQNVTMFGCNNSPEQNFNLHLIQNGASVGPKIIRKGIVIPDDTIPSVQMSTLATSSLLLINNQGKNILVNSPVVLTVNSPEIKCLGTVEKFVITPLTVVRLEYVDQSGQKQFVDFVNGSLEHDFIYDQKTSFSQKFKDQINTILSYTVTQIITVSRQSIRSINLAVKSGVILISKDNQNPSKDITLDHFFIPNNTTEIKAHETHDYLLGPFSAAVLGNQVFYNSGPTTLYYGGVTGITVVNGLTQVTSAAPLDSGYVKFYSDCQYRGSETTAYLGQYSYEIGHVNNSAPPNNLANQQNQQNPIKLMGPNKIASLILGPYTKVILYTSSQYDGRNQLFENNSASEVKYNLCSVHFNNITNSLKIDYAATYVGYGLIYKPPETFEAKTYQETCQQSHTPVTTPIVSVTTPAAFSSPVSSITFPKFADEIRTDNAVIAPISHLLTSLPRSPSSLQMLPTLPTLPTLPMLPTSSVSPISLAPVRQNLVQLSDSLTNSLTNIIKTNNTQQNRPHRIHLNCQNKAIMGVKTNVDNNSIIYEYVCGDHDLQNVRTYHRTVRDTNHNLPNILKQKVMCPDGEQLISFDLNSKFHKQENDQKIFQFDMTYQCGFDSKSVENFDLSYSVLGNEYHFNYPTNLKKWLNVPKQNFTINGNNAIAYLKKFSGQIDQYILNKKPVEIMNHIYHQLSIEPMTIGTPSQVETFGSNASAWIFLLVLVVLFVMLLYAAKVLRI